MSLLERVAEVSQALRVEVEKRVVGQHQVVDGLLTALLANGHALLVGVPGLAKTLLVSTLAEALDLKFSRIQFTPDLMPTDITGTEVIEEDRTSGHRAFRFVRGPIFANVVLADEINRTPPKTQAALLQAMQEREVTAAGQTYPLTPPFFVLATQNPIEQEGTYPLPEAQLDRFLLQIDVGYPDIDAERAILLATTGGDEEPAQAAMSADMLIAAQRLIRRIPVAESVVEAILKLVRAGRPEGDDKAGVARHIAWGPGPRASQALMLASRARAVLQGRLSPSVDDVLTLAGPVLRHRMALNFAARADGVTITDVVRRLCDTLR